MIVKVLILVTVGVLMSSKTGLCESVPAQDVYGTDALGRKMPERSEVRAFRSDRYVGAFYFLWLNMGAVHDVSKILREHPDAVYTSDSPPWGPRHAFHFWGEPMFGYYRSDDPWVLRRHAKLLADAGVDFLVFDTTNAIIYENVVMKLCEVFEQQRLLGERVPRISFMVNTKSGDTAQRIFEKLYQPNLYPDLWFRWKGKPLLICDPEQASEQIREFFTLRKAHWPFELVNTQNAWHWEATYPQVISYDTDPEKPEQINVSVGQNLHQDDGRVEMMSTGRARGRSFHKGSVDDRPESWKYGFNFEEQWSRAHEVDPEIVFVTGWNEWVAMQLADNGPAVFCDQFNLEFSRDVEMMKGGYGDNYYMQMAANIRRFKGMPSAPIVSSPKSIDISGDFSQWDDISPEYQDSVMDTEPRDCAGCGEFHYTVGSGRNDFQTLKVTQDDQNLYFLAKTREAITARTDPNWMWLFIDVRGDGLPDWEGFSYRINGSPLSDAETSVEICTGGWEWKSLGKAQYRYEGNTLHIAVPKALLRIQGNTLSIEFKWFDNVQTPGDILDAYVNGDTAPNGRFRYRYTSS